MTRVLGRQQGLIVRRSGDEIVRTGGHQLLKRNEARVTSRL